jgi:phage-related tail protein
MSRRHPRRFPSHFQILPALAASMFLWAALAGTAAAAAKTAPETALHRIQRTVAAIDAEAATPGGETRVISRLSQQLRTSPDSLQAQHAAWGLTYGEMAMAYGFARASRAGKTPADVVAMRRAGTDWRLIAKELNVKVDAVANRMKRHAPPKTKS